MSMLQFDHVRRTFERRSGNGAGAQVVLEDISLELAEGDIVALMGRSGAGKTTLLYLAAGLARPSAGRVLLGGRDLASLSAGELSRLRRREIGLVFQNNLALSALPVWENVALPLRLEGMRAAEARRTAGQWLERMGLAEFAGADTAALSGGQRRRLGLARAMAAQPRLLLADEPTADLDTQTAGEMESLMTEWLAERGATALIVTHTPRMRRLAARTLWLEAGRLGPLPPEAASEEPAAPGAS